MASKQKEPQTAEGTEAGPAELTLDEFCTRHSKADRRVELIGAFHSEEVRNGRVKDLESNYLERFEAFATQPV